MLCFYTFHRFLFCISLERGLPGLPKTSWARRKRNPWPYISLSLLKLHWTSNWMEVPNL